MRNSVIVKKNVVNEDLYYKNEQIISITINYPHFQSLKFSHCINYINDYFFSKLVLDSKQEILKLYKSAQTEYEYARANNYPFRKYEYFLDFFITYNDNCTISLYYDIYTYTAGAHGTTLRQSDTLDLNKCEPTFLADYLVDKRNYRDIIIREIIAQIKETEGTDQFIYFEEYVKLVEETFDEDNFYLDESNGGVVIYFQQYDIAPYSSGIPTFKIPFSV